MLAVGGADVDAHARCGAAVVHHAHLEVHKAQLFHLRVEYGQHAAQRKVQRVDGAVALGCGQLDLVAHAHLERGQRAGDVVGALAERLKVQHLVEAPVLAQLAAHHQLEAVLGVLELVALELHLLELAADVVDDGVVAVDGGVHGVDEGEYAVAPGKVGHHERARVAHRGGADVLEGAGVFHHAVDVHAALVGERAAADVGHAAVGGEVCHGADKVRKRRQLGQAGEAIHAHLEHEVGDHAAQVGIAAALAKAVDGALHQHRAHAHRGQRAGDRHAAVVVAMDAHAAGEFPDDGLYGVAHVLGQRAAVGVAQHEEGSARVPCGAQRLHRVARVGGIAVEKMLRVKEHRLARGGQEAHGLGDHVEVFLQGGAQHVGDMEVPAFAKYRDVRTAHVGQHVQPGVLMGLRAHAPGGAERHQLRILKPHAAHALEQLGVARVAGGIARLDKVHARLVQPTDEQLLILQRKRDGLTLRAVAQRGIVDVHSICFSSSKQRIEHGVQQQRRPNSRTAAHSARE